MNLVLTVNGTAYNAAARAAMGVRIDDLSLELGASGSLSFSERGAGPTSLFTTGKTVSLTADSVLVYSGRVVDKQSSADNLQWIHGHTCVDNRWMVERFVPITAVDQTGLYIFNSPPDDTFGNPTDRGLSIGVIFTRVLEIIETAQGLAAFNVGNYTGLPSVATLPSTTVADLASLTVVPTTQVTFQGNNILAQFANLLNRYMPRFEVHIEPGGDIRFLDTRDIGAGLTFVPQAITMASRYGAGDPLPSYPLIRESVGNCAPRVRFRGGPEVEGILLSEVDGTLAQTATSTDITNWTLYAFTAPVGYSDYGTISSCTTSSATIVSHDGTFTEPLNFWSTNTGTIFLLNTIADSNLATVVVGAQRQVTASDAMTAGASATVHWDGSEPLSEVDYNKYRIVASTGGLSTVWRDYEPVDPYTGNKGLSTYVGKHMVRRSPKKLQWVTATTVIGVYYAQGQVTGPFKQTLPWDVDPVPSLGLFRFRRPTVSAYGNESHLYKGSPTTVNDGKPADVQVFAPYSIGALSTVYPPDVSGVPQYSGTSATDWAFTETIDTPSWTIINDQADITTLTHEHQKTTQDKVYDVSVAWNVCNGVVPAWSFLTFGWALNIAIAGTTSPWSDINVIPRLISIRPEGVPITQILTFRATNRQKAFTGDDLYLHPALAQDSALLQATQGTQGGIFGSDMTFRQTGDPTEQAFNTAANFNASSLDAGMSQASQAMRNLQGFSQSMGPMGGVGGGQGNAAGAGQAQALAPDAMANIVARENAAKAAPPPVNVVDQADNAAAARRVRAAKSDANRDGVDDAAEGG